MRAKTDHVRVKHGTENECLVTFCERCGVRMLTPVPVEISRLVALTEGFIRLHRDCTTDGADAPGRTA
jgi:hypothetical protein